MRRPTYEDAQRAAATVGACWGCDHGHLLTEGGIHVGLDVDGRVRAIYSCARQPAPEPPSRSGLLLRLRHRLGWGLARRGHGADDGR